MDDPEGRVMKTTGEPDRQLVELSDLLVGAWQVNGRDIVGRAEYQTKRGGTLLVAHVDFRVAGLRMAVIQHISHHRDSGTLRAHYMDTMGEIATYTWTLNHPTIRVSLGNADSDTYFRAILNDDNSQYAGTWHYPESETDPTEAIVYTRINVDE